MLVRDSKLFGGVALGDTVLAVCGDEHDALILGGMAGPMSLPGHSSYINSLAAVETDTNQFSLVSASADTTLRTWRVFVDGNGKLSHRSLRVFKGHRGPVRSCCFLDAAGERFASAGGHDDMSVRLWCTAAAPPLVARLACSGSGGSRTGTMRGHTAPVECVARVSENLIASASLDETVRLWDVHSLRATAVLRGHRREALCVSAAHPLLVSSSDDRTIRGWDVRSSSASFVVGGVHSGSIYAVEVLSTPTPLCVSGGADGRLAAYDLRMLAAPTPASASRRAPLYMRERAHGIRAVNKLVQAAPPLSLGGSDAAALWSVGDDGCVRAWQCGAVDFEERTPLNGHAHAVLQGAEPAELDGSEVS
jgi:WD40 repeat protein